MSSIKDILWNKESQIRDLKKQIKYNIEQNKRLMKSWEDLYNNITNYIIDHKDEVLSDLDFSTVLEMLKRNKPC
jgi:hypothetical protein